MAKVAVISGDGIANEVIPEAAKVLAVVNEKFETFHGTGPDLLGKGVANPVTAIMASTMPLEHLATVKQRQLSMKPFPT